MNTRTIVTSIGLTAVLAVGSPAGADVVTDWNSSALDAIRAERAPPPIASRALAILHASIYDAINGIARTHEPYFVQSAVPSSASKEAAASAAAHKILVALFPAQAPGFDALHAATLATLSDGPRKSHGVAWAESVAGHILALRANDNSQTSIPLALGSSPGAWQPTPPGFAPFLLPQWAFVAPFAMPADSHFRPTGPPAP